MRLRAVIEGNVKRCYVDFYKETEKIFKAIQDIDSKKNFHNIKFNDVVVQIRFTKSSNDVLKELISLIDGNDNVDLFYIQCRRLLDNNFIQYFLEHYDNYHSVSESYVDYIMFQLETMDNHQSHKVSLSNPSEFKYEMYYLFNHKVLFTSLRVNEELLPKEIYKYEVRSDELGKIIEMAENVVVNYWGTILSSKEFKLDENGYIKIIEGKDLVDINEVKIHLCQYLKR
ncbi:MAG: LPD28 domain-containing protein [Thomasclavelia sp.]